MDVVTFECEWDIGINDDIFANEDLARKAVAAALVACGIEETLEECEDENLVTFEHRTIITRLD